MWGTGLIESAFKSRRFLAALSTCISSDFVEISVARLKQLTEMLTAGFHQEDQKLGGCFLFFLCLSVHVQLQSGAIGVVPH